MNKVGKKKSIFFGCSLILLILIVNGTICSSETRSYCMLSHYSKMIFEPLLITSLSIFIVSILTFFISDKTFKKWLVFAVVWFFTDIIWVIISPVTSHYYFDIGPTTKESVSIWMGIFFVIVSILMFGIFTIKERVSHKK